MLYRTKIGLTVELYTPFQYFDVWVQEFTKEQIMEIAWTEHVKRLDMEQKLKKLLQIVNSLERTTNKEEVPLIEQAFQKRLEEEKILLDQERLVSFLLLIFCVYVRAIIQNIF